MPDGFYALNGTMLFGLPITGFYVLAIAVTLWIVLEYLPIGRYVYAIGANPKAAALNGIPVRRFVIGAFVSSGFLTALTGVLLASKLRIGQASVGLEYLLPALVGAFLGSTTIKPGRVNVWGTMIGVIILAVGISGIQQFGGSFFVEPLFNGVTLLVAIGIAGYAQRKRGAAAKLPRNQIRPEANSRTVDQDLKNREEGIMQRRNFLKSSVAMLSAAIVAPACSPTRRGPMRWPTPWRSSKNMPRKLRPGMARPPARGPRKARQSSFLPAT